MSDKTDDQIETRSEYVSENGTAYTVQVQRIHGQSNNAFERRDISTPFTLYVVFTGPDVYSHHDKYKLIRNLPGDASWLHDHFDRLEAEL
jgi:hypothetical protein